MEKIYRYKGRKIIYKIISAEDGHTTSSRIFGDNADIRHSDEMVFIDEEAEEICNILNKYNANSKVKYITDEFWE